MNHREWVKDTIAHKDAGAVPWNLGLSPLPRAALEKHFGADDLETALDLPIRMNGPASIKPLYADPDQYGPTVIDEFQVVWTTNAIDRGSPVVHPLKEPHFDRYIFPYPQDAYRFRGLAEWRRANRDCYTVIWIGDLWERATFMRGMENLLMDVVLHHEFVEELLERLATHILLTMKALFEQCEVDCVALSDDYGTQNGLLISPDHWRYYVKRRLRRIFDFAKSAGCDTFLHSCGNITEIVGDLVDVGLDILHPIQPEALDIRALKRDFGNDLAFCGGLSTQSTLPHGSPQDVRNEVRALKRDMGKGGGYILEPGITVQADVPIENLLAFIDEAKR